MDLFYLSNISKSRYLQVNVAVERERVWLNVHVSKFNVPAWICFPSSLLYFFTPEAL